MTDEQKKLLTEYARLELLALTATIRAKEAAVAAEVASHAAHVALGEFVASVVTGA